MKDREEKGEKRRGEEVMEEEDDRDCRRSRGVGGGRRSKPTRTLKDISWHRELKTQSPLKHK